MKNYTVKHTSKLTMVSAVFKRGGMSETLQYEFQGALTETSIDAVYNNLSKSQRDSLNINKNSFKQFIRAIKLKHPECSNSTAYRGAGSLLNEEKVYLASRLSAHIGITSNESVKRTIGYGTINEGKYTDLVKDKPNAILVKSENLIYWVNNGFIIAFKTTPVNRTRSGQDMYIYVTLLIS